MNANPAADEKGEDFKKEVLLMLMEIMPTLKKINKEPVTDEDIKDAVNERIEREKAEEAARLEREAAEKQGEQAEAE